MNEVILVASIVLAAATTVFAAITFIRTRNKYYQDYLRRKRDGEP